MPAPLTVRNLRQIATTLEDARALMASGRLDGGVYLCGYAVEMALKARICRTLRWTSWPEGGEYRTFKAHNLDVLLNLSGRETKIRTMYQVQWSTVVEWNPESRYSPPGQATALDLQAMISATEDLLQALR